MQQYVIGAISVIGAGALIGVFWTKRPGFGPQTLRAVGIVLVATFVSLLAPLSESGFSAAIGILGAIVGYLFGIRFGSGD